MAGLMDILGRPEFAMYLSNLGQGLQNADRGQPMNMGPGNMALMQMAQQRKQGEKLKGLMEGMEGLTPQQRGLLDALPPEMAMKVLAQQQFPQGQEQPSDVREYQYYVQQAQAAGQQPMNYMDYQQALRRSGASSVNVNTGETMPQVGTIPQGYQLRQTPEGTWTLERIPGGPAEEEATAAAAAGSSAAEAREQQADVVLTHIADARRIMEESTLPTTGFWGARLVDIEGTGAFDLREKVKTLKSNIGFDRLQKMREESPTGGALGQVSNQEIDLLNSTLGSLETAQSREEFERTLDRVEAIYNRIMEKARAYPTAAKYGFGGGGAAGAGASAPQPAIEAERTIGGKRYVKRGGRWYEAQ